MQSARAQLAATLGLSVHRRTDLPTAVVLVVGMDLARAMALRCGPTRTKDWIDAMAHALRPQEGLPWVVVTPLKPQGERSSWFVSWLDARPSEAVTLHLIQDLEAPEADEQLYRAWATRLRAWPVRTVFVVGAVEDVTQDDPVAALVGRLVEDGLDVRMAGSSLRALSSCSEEVGEGPPPWAVRHLQAQLVQWAQLSVDDRIPLLVGLAAQVRREIPATGLARWESQLTRALLQALRFAAPSGRRTQSVSVDALCSQWSASTSFIGVGGRSATVLSLGDARWDRYGQVLSRLADQLGQEAVPAPHVPAPASWTWRAPVLGVDAQGALSVRSGRHEVAVLRDLGAMALTVDVTDLPAARVTSLLPSS